MFRSPSEALQQTEQDKCYVPMAQLGYNCRALGPDLNSDNVCSHLSSLQSWRGQVFGASPVCMLPPESPPRLVYQWSGIRTVLPALHVSSDPYAEASPWPSAGWALGQWPALLPVKAWPLPREEDRVPTAGQCASWRTGGEEPWGVGGSNRERCNRWMLFKGQAGFSAEHRL